MTGGLSQPDFAGRRVLITGGGSGTGAAMARAFAGAGAQVVISGRRRLALDAVAAASSLIRPVVCDITDEVAVTALFDHIAATGPVADIVIANAGMAASAPLEKTELSLWSEIMAVNLTGPFLTFREGLRRMRGADVTGGRLIAVASLTAKRAYPYISAYAASKHGVLGLVKSAALEVAANSENGQQMTVNAICPGYLDTEMTQKSIATITAKTGLSEAEAAGKLHGFTPQRRLFTADEVAATALFLAGEAAAGINGQAISVDGGESW